MSQLISLKDYIQKFEQSVKELTTTVNDIKLLMVSDYVKKTDCEQCQKDNQEAHNNLRNWIIGLIIAIMGVGGSIIAAIINN